MFCRICGKELNEQAFACPGCGCLVGAAPKKPKKTTEKRENKGGLFKLFLILSVSLVALSLMFSFGAVVFPELILDIYTYSAEAYLYTGILAVPAILTGVCGLGFSITAFVMGLKQQDSALKMLAISNFIFSIAVYVVSIFTCIGCYYL
jgi:hypothetical protein